MKFNQIFLTLLTFISLSFSSNIEEYFAQIFGENQLEDIKACYKADEQCELILDPSNGYLSYTISELSTNQKVLAIFKNASREDRIAVGTYTYPEYGPSYMNSSINRYPYSRFMMLKISEGHFDTLAVIPSLHPTDFGISGDWILFDNNQGSKVFRDPNDYVQIHFQEEIPQYGTNLKIHIIVIPSNRIEKLYRSINGGAEPSEEIKNEINKMKSMIDGIYSQSTKTFIECRWNREVERFLK